VQRLFNRNFGHQKINLLRAFSLLACFGSLAAVGLMLDRPGCGSHVLVCKMLGGQREGGRGCLPVGWDFFRKGFSRR
jgi:hypothetical protein